MEAIVFDIINTYNLSSYGIKKFINAIKDNENYSISINDGLVVDGGKYISITKILMQGKTCCFGFKAEWDEKTAKYYIYTDKVYLYNTAHNINRSVAHHHYAFVNTELTIGEITAKMISMVVSNISKLEEIACINKVTK